MPCRLLTPLVVALLLMLAPAASLADGDPASDVLLGENVYYPYSPPVTPATQRALNAQTTAAKRAGFPLKVALIAAPTDLGVIPDLFGKPQPYAKFLDQEISFRGKQPLLVVMQSGYGEEGLTPRARAALATLPKPTGSRSEDLAQAALTAVTKLADASGHPISPSPSSAPSSKSSSNTTTIVVIALIAAALATAAALGALTLRRRRAPSV